MKRSWKLALLIAVAVMATAAGCRSTGSSSGSSSGGGGGILSRMTEGSGGR
jgi:hypothetical protein